MLIASLQRKDAHLTSVLGSTGVDEPHGTSVWMANGSHQLVSALQGGTTDVNMLQNECTLGECAAIVC